jgi:hypothetical protein
VEKLTLRYIVANQQALLADLERRQAIVRDHVRGVALGYATGLYLHGSPGGGKTHLIRTVLEVEVQEIFCYQRGHLTPLGLFELIADHPDETIVLDDLATLLQSDIALQVLLAALEHPTGRDRSRLVKYRRQGKEKRVWFRGGVICICNLLLNDAAILSAFKSRVHTLNHNPSDAHLGAQILSLAEKGWPPECPTIAPKEGIMIARFLIEEMLRLDCRFDLRLLVNKAFPVFQQFKDGETESDWRDLVTASVQEELIAVRHGQDSPVSRAARLEEERAIVREILCAHTTRQDQVQAWVARTGKSDRAFYRRLAEVINH